ncbi:MAG: iron ABC transporter permease [Pseudomonadota bacterium]
MSSRNQTILLALTLSLVCLAIAGLALGSSFMPLDRVVSAVVGAGRRADSIIVWNIRMPRLLLALLAGACLGLAGACLQFAVRNALASPSILGVTDGAAVGVLVFFLVFSDEANALTVSIRWQPVFAILGAGLAAALVAALVATGRRHRNDVVLYGIAVGALASAVSVTLIIKGPIYQASQALIWMAGSVHEASWRDVTVLAAFATLTIPMTLLLSRPVGQLSLDDASAASTGVPVALVRFGLAAAAVLLTAVAVSFAGAIGFVGLIAPHMARLLTRAQPLAMLTGSVLLGSAIVLAADLIARLTFQPLEIPVGAMTAGIGAPYFLWLLYRSGKPRA